MAKKKVKTEVGEEHQVLKAVGSPDKIIPKFCTNIGFGITQDKHVVISLNFQEDNQNLLIDRVIITIDHAKKVSEVLTDLLERASKDENNTSTNK